MKFWLWQKLPSHNGQLENQAKICEKNAWRNFSSGNRNYDPCEGKKSRINHMVGTAYFLKAWSVPTCLDRRNPSVILWLIELRRLQEEFAWYSVSAVGGYNIGEARAAKRETLRGLQERLLSLWWLSANLHTCWRKWERQEKITLEKNTLSNSPGSLMAEHSFLSH